MKEFDFSSFCILPEGFSSNKPPESFGEPHNSQSTISMRALFKTPAETTPEDLPKFELVSPEWEGRDSNTMIDTVIRETCGMASLPSRPIHNSSTVPKTGTARESSDGSDGRLRCLECAHSCRTVERHEHTERSVPELPAIHESEALYSPRRQKIPDQIPQTSTIPSIFLQTKAERKKLKKEAEKRKAKAKKAEKKRKRKIEKQYNKVSDSLSERNSTSSNHLAELLKTSTDVILYEKKLWIYNRENGCFEISDKDTTARIMRSLLDKDEQLKVRSNEYAEAYKQLLISEEIRSDEGFLENEPFVNCENGIVDIENDTLLEHTPDKRFKHCIRARYDPDADCSTFFDFVDTITGGDQELVRLFQTILGYILSGYNNAKKAIFIISPSHCGKSVLCNLIERIIGPEFVSNADLARLQSPEYVASLHGMLLNIAPDLTNEVMRDIGYFKSLTSNLDTLFARGLYDNPTKIKCETKILVSTNHLLAVDRSLSEGDVTAFFNRVLYFPFMNKPISPDEEDKHLADKLYDERDGIFTWAIEGLQRYIENNGNFPFAHESDRLLYKNLSMYCPEKFFVDTCLKIENERYESTSAIKKAFEMFCEELGITSNTNITKYLESLGYSSKRKRFNRKTGEPGGDDANLYSVKGLRLRNKYRADDDTDLYYDGEEDDYES